LNGLNRLNVLNETHQCPDAWLAQVASEAFTLTFSTAVSYVDAPSGEKPPAGSFHLANRLSANNT
jgi:hypothetical protein